jgi:hypothetical protein
MYPYFDEKNLFRGDLHLFGILIIVFVGLKVTMGGIFFEIKK